jgi:phospholipid/cholesterol/gamma-HCH transport system substrate-binding protein
MGKPFKFRYVNEIAGGFVLLVAALLVAGVLLAGHAQRWFTPTHRLALTFPAEGSLGLQKGAEVQVLGTQVGSVEEITVAEDGNMAARVTIRGDFFRFVRSDSKALVKKKFGLAGDAYVEITKGVGGVLPAGATLMCTKDTELIEMLQDVVKQVKEATLPAIEQARKAVEEYTNLGVDLRNPEGNLQQLLTHLNNIAGELEKGEGTAGKLLRDPALANELQGITAKINDALGEVQVSLRSLSDTMAVVKGEAEDLPGVVLQTRETMRETEKLIVAIQKHWLLRGYVEQSEPSTLIPPSEAGGGGK